MKDRSHITDDSLEKGGRDEEWERERRGYLRTCVSSRNICLQPTESPTHSTVENVRCSEELGFAQLNFCHKTEFPQA